MFRVLTLICLSVQAGHWEGKIKLPERDFLFSIDLNYNPDWSGAFSIPGGKGPPLALSSIEVDPPAVHFEIREMPGDPLFKGVFDAERTSVLGTVTQGSRTVAFEMLRTGDATVPPMPKNTPLGRPFWGAWEGTLLLDGQATRLVLHLHNDEDGLGAGTLDTAGPGAKNLIVSGITQTGSHLSFEVRLIGGAYQGELNTDDSAISGTWTQGERSAPLAFLKVN